MGSDMANKPLPTINDLRQLLRYDADTGKLYWRPRAATFFEAGIYGADRKAAIWNNRFAGKEALTALTDSGYKQGWVMSCHLRAHRVAWAIHYGEWADKSIDHINQNRADNRIKNLRLATPRQNARNSSRRRGSSSKYKGVGWYKAYGKWDAKIKVEGAVLFLGYFDDEVEAAKAYDAAAVKHFGEFAALNL